MVACIDGETAEDGLRDGASLALLSCRAAAKGGSMGDTERAVTDAECAR